MVPPGGGIQALLLGHGFKPVIPVYKLRLSAADSAAPSGAMARLLPAKEMSRDLLSRQGQADVDRIDRISRSMVRESDHLYWLKNRSARAVFVRQGNRIAAYGYGGPFQVGPVTGSTQEAAMCALGHAMQMAVETAPGQDIVMYVPASFTPAVTALLEHRATIDETLLVYGRQLNASFDRVVFGNPTLP